MLRGMRLFLLIGLFVPVYQTPPPLETVWGTKPVLSYVVLNPELAVLMQQAVGLTAEQVQMVHTIAVRETEQLHSLYQNSEVLLRDESLNLRQKREGIEAMQYNQRADQVVAESAKALVAALGKTSYMQLVAWIEQQWLVEREVAAAQWAGSQAAASRRTVRVFATQYAANTQNEVALPDKCLKFANRRWSLRRCPTPAYKYGQDYAVKLVRGKYTVAHVHVWDAGPWNIDDNYWSTTRDAQYRRRFRDLPLGRPEAEAAYFDNYNGGRDQYGRRVLNPAGIDLSVSVRQALGLKRNENAWIMVTYLWTTCQTAQGETAMAAVTCS